MKLYRNWIINEVARAGEHTNERTYVRTYVRTYSHTYVRDRPYIPSTTLLCEGIIICFHMEANFVLSELTSIQKGDKWGNGRLASPETVSIHLKSIQWTCNFIKKKIAYLQETCEPNPHCLTGRHKSPLSSETRQPLY